MNLKYMNVMSTRQKQNQVMHNIFIENLIKERLEIDTILNYSPTFQLTTDLTN